MPDRHVDPQEEHEWVECQKNEAHYREQRWERDAMHDPFSWVTAPLCPTCGRPLVAQETCAACGDESEMAA